MKTHLPIRCSVALAGLAIGLAYQPVWAQTSPSDYTTGSRYDGMRRLAGVIRPDPDAGGSIKYGAIRNSYDGNGRLIKVEKGELATWQSQSVAPSAWTGFTIFTTTDISYDAVWRKTKEVVSSGGVTFTVTQFSYDNDNRLECTAVRMNSAVFGSLPASACALGTQGTDGPDRIAKNIYDAASQKLQEQRALGVIGLQQNYVTYTYSNNGKQTSVTDANGNKAALAWDGFDRQSYWYFPSPTTPGTVSTTDYEQYGYDANSNRISLRKRDGRTIGYSYDALNRLSLKDIPSSTTDDVYYRYDLRNLQLDARFGSISGLGISNGYDNAGRLTSNTNSTGGGSGWTLAYQYDANGNRIQLTFPDANAFTFDYDGLNRMVTIKEGSSTSVATIAYNARGERTSLAGGGSTAYGYDAISRLASINHDFAGTAQDVGFSFATYNGASQVLTRSISNDSYAFPRNNLSEAYAVNGLNQYTTVGGSGLSHDVNGNLTSYAGTTYGYDVENRLISASGATNATLTYDPTGRLFKLVSGTTTQFLYDGNALVAEYDGSGVMQRRYVHGPGVDEPILWYVGSGFGTRQYLRPDQHGSVVAISDSGSASIGINTYDEWGNPGASNLGRFAYTGQIRLPQIAMYYYKARIYSPKLGRFLQTDPVGYSDQINLYAYVANDPVNKTDPTGQYECTGDRAQCSAVAAAYNRANEALKSDELSKGEKAKLQSSLSALGKPGEKNGVNVSFASQRDIAQKTRGGFAYTEKTKDGARVVLPRDFAKSFDSYKNNTIVMGPPKPGEFSARDSRANALVHEGVHVRQFYSGMTQEQYDEDPSRYENQAYPVGNLVNEAFGTRPF